MKDENIPEDMDQNGHKEVYQKNIESQTSHMERQADILIPDPPVKDTMQEEMVLETNNHLTNSTDLGQKLEIVSLQTIVKDAITILSPMHRLEPVNSLGPTH